jgi:hypothetical protein
LVSSGDELPEPSTVVRYVGFNGMRKDKDDRILGPYASAFEQRQGEDFLSVAWAEYYVGSPDSRLRCAIEALRKSRKVGSQACFCIADTDELLVVIAKHGRPGRAIYWPEDDNPAHAGIYGISPMDAILLETVAATAWCQFLTKNDTDNLPLVDCAKSPDVE